MIIDETTFSVYGQKRPQNTELVSLFPCKDCKELNIGGERFYIFSPSVTQAIYDNMLKNMLKEAKQSEVGKAMLIEYDSANNLEFIVRLNSDGERFELVEIPFSLKSEGSETIIKIKDDVFVVSGVYGKLIVVISRETVDDGFYLNVALIFDDKSFVKRVFFKSGSNLKILSDAYICNIKGALSSKKIEGDLSPLIAKMVYLPRLYL